MGQTMSCVRTISLIVLLLASFSFSLRSRAAATEDRATAREHFQRGERLYAVGKFQAALDEFTAAYEAAPLPEFLYNIAQCHRRLGHPDEALFFFKGFLDRSPRAGEVSTEVESLIQEQEEAKRAAERAKAAALAPSETASSQRLNSALTATSPHHEPARRPVYKRWWFWTTAAVVVVAGVATAVGVTAGSAVPRLPSDQLGTIDAR